MLPEFEAALKGAAAGETRAFALTFPADYHGKEVAGKTAQFALTVKQVNAPEIPPLDSAFATAFGIKSGSVDDLRAEVESNLKLELKRKLDATLKDQALKGLRQVTELTLPRQLVEQEALQLARRMAANLQQQGMKPEDIKLSPDMFRPQAEERVALGLILAEVVRDKQLEARPEQVRALVQDVAQTYEQPDAVVRWHFEKPERLSEFEALAVERNVVEWVLSQAKVTDAPTTFEALMGPAQA
jgi:trigger factor